MTRDRPAYFNTSTFQNFCALRDCPPPGKKVCDKGNYSVYEVDGELEKVIPLFFPSPLFSFPSLLHLPVRLRRVILLLMLSPFFCFCPQL